MHKIKVVVVESFLRTRAWEKALNQIIDVELYVINLMESEYQWHIDNGIDEGNILKLSNYQKSIDYTSYYNELRLVERGFKYKLNKMIDLDRILKKKDYSIALNYMSYIYGEVVKFFKKNDIDFVFMEPTWSHEILINEISNMLGVSVYFPHTCRLPSNRFMFFKGCEQVDYFKRKKSKSSGEEVGGFLLKTNLHLPKPDYYYINNKKNHVGLKDLITFGRHIKKSIKFKKNYFLTPMIYELVLNKLRKFYNYIIVKNSSIFIKKIDTNEKYILIPLHVQPEASVDVLAPKYANQIEFIRQISIRLDSDYKIYVKEHSNAIGDRIITFYKKIKEIPNVYLIDPYIDSKVLVEKSFCVLTLTGTIGFEAAINGKFYLTAVDMFYNEIVKYKSANSEVYQRVEDIYKENKQFYGMNTKEEILNNYRKLLMNSFEGVVTDEKSNKEVLSKENITKLQKAFSELLCG